MPIYAYKCGACGHAKDVLQRISDAPLTDCPACGASSFTKQITAAGFQLKGSGWYVTDFRGGSGAGGAAKADDKSAADAKPADATASDSKTSDSKTAESKPAESTTTKSDAPSASAGGCGASCACH
ncbi:MAG TPA: FmdB family zinc ribbon protein [Ramlibacter sp.]|uniref:FmdB family zinc ribbon protein n=1 Tax=Ramlibacter sp. TaxID=1917967 RepID=UPI002C62AE38|nr:FmdB family zinc ribbon protein [Ramlibacter sp.]HVZ42440.1 FmdB family zinc ribbon protein [Ramlibacter sp.]